MACRAVLATYADYDPTRIRSHDARFASPVFPGDVVTFDLWRDGNTISFEGRVKARDTKVITNGKTEVEYTIPGDKYFKKGHFALQAHDPGSIMSFKKIEVKELKK